jgi:hypothetical protein
VRTKHLLSFVAASLLAACATNPPASGLLYGLGDDELNLLGRRLGYRVEALGMSDYRFSRHGQSFRVLSHNDISLRERVQADQPVELRGPIRGKRGVVTSSLSIEHGLPFTAVENHFRSFIQATGLPSPRT